jgi:phosphonate transport system substrate-binding protein
MVFYKSQVKLFLLLILLIGIPRLVFADLILAVHPYIDSETLIKRFQPLANYLSLKLDRRVVVRVGKDYETHLQAIGRDTVDIAFLGPSIYVKMVEQYQKKPLLTRIEATGKPTFQGHIIVREDSNLADIKQLKQHFFAFGDKNSTMSTMVPKVMLEQNGIELENLKGYRHFKGHRNVAMAVLTGDADAGAVKEEVFEQFRSKGLRSLAKTPAISEHLFVTRSNMDPSLILQIKTIMLDIKTPEQIRSLLKPIKNNITGLTVVNDNDYNSLRQIMGISNTGNKSESQ